MAYPTRAQRDTLNSLSLQLFGLSSRWQKVMKSTPIFSHYEPYKPRDKEYSRALAQWRASGAETEFQVPKKAYYRDPSYDEMIQSLQYFVDVNVYRSTNPEKVIAKAVDEFVGKTLSVALNLQVLPEEQEDFLGLLDRVSPDHKEWVTRMVNVTDGSPSMVNLSGPAFVSALVERQANAV